MKTKLILLTIFCSFFALTIKADENDELLYNLQQTHYGSNFLLNHSKNDFLQILKFLNEPICFFKKIIKINNFIEYVEIVDRYSSDKLNANESIFLTFLQKHFTHMNSKKADILNFLILNSDGMYGELLADKYTMLFKKYTSVFIKSLKKTQWKKVVDKLGSGNWVEFSEGINKLGDSKFENEFKDYLQSKNWRGNDGVKL